MNSQLKGPTSALSIASFKALGEITLLVGIALVIHALVLDFVFPGYYRPLWPNHSDFYIPVALAHSGLGFFEYLQFPRPVGVIFFDAIGHLGIRGAMLAVIVVVLLNCALTAALFRRVAKIEISWSFFFAFAIYAFLVFSHPYFYVSYVWDAFAELSYTLLALAIWCFYRYAKTPHTPLLVASVALILFSFLAKETYGLSALLLSMAWFLAKRKDGALRAAIPALAVGTTLALALLINAINGSSFTGAANYAGSPYQIVLTPTSLLTQWGRYAVAGQNVLTISVLLLIALTTFVFMRASYQRWLAVLLPAAAALAWLPNATLPNHYYAGYSWSGAYLLFVPMLLVVPLWKCGRVARACSVAILILAVASPALFTNAYKTNSWTLEQEARQHHLLQALQRLTSALPSHVGPGPEQILVTGIDFPFTPFDHGLSMRSFPHGRDTQFDVLAYAPRGASVTAFPRLEAQPSGVRFISPSEVDLARYQQVWAFRSDGTLVKDVHDPAHLAIQSGAASGFSAADLMVFPKLFDIFASQQASSKRPDGYQYLNCGAALLSYGNLAGAEKCLESSLRLLPGNPYPHFYLGEIQQKQGLIDLARASFDRAIALDDPKSPNPYFRQALELISKVPSHEIKLR